MNNPLVSVVLSVYNGEQYLAEAIESILNQSYTNFELILVDDGSTDSSLEIIKSYDDKRIILISRENRGLIASLNEGILKAKGKYIARMDADDISLSTRFEEQVAFLEQNPKVGLCGTAIIGFSEEKDGAVWILAHKSETIKTQMLFSSSIAHPTVMMRHELILKYQLFYDENFKHAEDFELWTRFANVTELANLKIPLLKYRVLKNSASRMADKDVNRRYEIISNITKSYVKKLKIQNSKEESWLHFNLSTNDRMNESNISFDKLNDYFIKLLKANKQEKLFNSLELKKVLGKKWLWNFYYRREVKALFSKYIFYGIWSLLRK